MVLIALSCVVVGPEALASRIVVMVCPAPSPSVAFYAKVVVARTGKVASARAALKQALRQRYAGRNVISKHLFYRQVLILVDVRLVYLVPLNLRQGALHIKQCAQ